MRIEIINADQFDSLLNALADEIVDAEVYFKLHNDLLAAIPDYEEALNQSNTFWSLTVNALRDAALSGLCRAYDQNSDSLNLTNLLDTIEANVHVFDTEDFKERLRDNPFVESLAQTPRKPNVNTLHQDMSLVKADDPLTKKLVIWRNNIVAHRTASNVVNQRDITKDYPLTRDEVSELLARATRILNRYSGLFRASTYSTHIVGRDDYLHVLDAVKEKVHRHKEDMASEITRLRKSDDTQDRP